MGYTLKHSGNRQILFDPKDEYFWCDKDSRNKMKKDFSSVVDEILPFSIVVRMDFQTYWMEEIWITNSLSDNWMRRWLGNKPQTKSDQTYARFWFAKEVDYIVFKMRWWEDEDVF